MFTLYGLQYQGEKVCIVITKREQPAHSPSRSHAVNVFNKNIEDSVKELEVSIHFDDVERQKRLWTEIPQLLTRGRVSRPTRSISYPLMCLPATVSLFEHLGIDVAWYVRELAEQLSDKLKANYLNSSSNGAASGASALKKLKSMINKLFCLDEEYIQRRGKGWNAIRDISGGPDWSSVHVRRILSRKEHASAAEYHRLQVRLR